MSRMSLPVVVALVLAPAGLRAATLEVRVNDASGKPVADAVVQAAAPNTPTEAKGAKTVEIQQVEREFVPYVTAVQAGTPVSFPNRDAIAHHVYSFAAVKTFEIKLYTGKAPAAIVFDKPGVVPLGCNIHDWMIGYVYVAATPHFAKTDALGVATLKDLPSGTYEVRAWHPQQRAAAPPQSVTLDVAGSHRAQAVLDVVPRKPRYKPPLDRLKY